MGSPSALWDHSPERTPHPAARNEPPQRRSDPREPRGPWVAQLGSPAAVTMASLIPTLGASGCWSRVTTGLGLFQDLLPGPCSPPGHGPQNWTLRGQWLRLCVYSPPLKILGVLCGRRREMETRGSSLGDPHSQGGRSCPSALTIPRHPYAQPSQIPAMATGH